MKVPPEIIAKIESIGVQPQVQTRALCDIEGNIGETWVVADKRHLLLLSRRLGEDFAPSIIPMSKIESFEITNERPFTYLCLVAPGIDTLLKFGSADSAALKQICQLRNSDARPPPPPPVPDEAEVALGSIPPFVTFCAALHALIQTDGEVNETELTLLDLVVDDTKMLAAGLACWRQLGSEQLVAEIAHTFNAEQKLCLMINLLEIAMSDGYLRSHEKALLKQLRDGIGVDPAAFSEAYRVIMAKNNMGVFSDE
jgi:uncharacterized tellurite resistance protein B-like protein